jgi:hypothetical protein
MREVGIALGQKLAWDRDNPEGSCNEPLANAGTCHLPEGHPAGAMTARTT